MDTSDIISLTFGSIGAIFGTLGAATGCYATWLNHKAMRQELTIIRTNESSLSFRVTNYSLRPIPILSLSLEIKEDGVFNPSSHELSLHGVTIPGVLAPESSFKIQLSGTEQIVEMIVYEAFRLTVTTQTENTFTLEDVASKKANKQSLRTSVPADDDEKILI
jgi:hypothetical protein